MQLMLVTMAHRRVMLPHTENMHGHWWRLALVGAFKAGNADSLMGWEGSPAQ